MRILGIDFARSLAIFFAMLAHVFVEAGAHQYLSPDISRVLGVVFQLATPIFVLLFGTMLELAYYPKWQSGQQRQITARLIKRAIQCWILYAISIFSLVLVDEGYSLKFAVACILFMGNSPYTEILKFYAVALLVAPLLLWARARFGLVPLVILAVCVQAAWPLFNALPDVQHDLGFSLKFARVVKFFSGFGSPQLAGPSIIHGLGLVIFGQCIGWFIARSRVYQTIPKPGQPGKPVGFSDNIPKAAIFFLILTVIGALIAPKWVLDGLADMSLRMNSHFIYFAAGTLSAVAVTMAFIWALDARPGTRSPIWYKLSFFGRTSMFTFAWGNILLYLIDYRPDNAAGAFITAAALMATICLMSFAFDALMRNSQQARSLLEMINRPLDLLAQRLVQR